MRNYAALFFTAFKHCVDPVFSRWRTADNFSDCPDVVDGIKYKQTRQFLHDNINATRIMDAVKRTSIIEVVPDVPSDLFKNNVNVTDFTGCLKNCGLTEIPNDLFKNNREVTTFKDCLFKNNLQSIPNNLFANNRNVVDFSKAFQYNKLTEIPPTLFSNNTKATTFTRTFNDNPLTKIPTNLFINNLNIINLDYCFADTKLSDVCLRLPATNIKYCNHLFDKNVKGTIIVKKDTVTANTVKRASINHFPNVKIIDAEFYDVTNSGFKDNIAKGQIVVEIGGEVDVDIKVIERNDEPINDKFGVAKYVEIKVGDKYPISGFYVNDAFDNTVFVSDSGDGLMFVSTAPIYGDLNKLKISCLDKAIKDDGDVDWPTPRELSIEEQLAIRDEWLRHSKRHPHGWTDIEYYINDAFGACSDDGEFTINNISSFLQALKQIEREGYFTNYSWPPGVEDFFKDHFNYDYQLKYVLSFKTESAINYRYFDDIIELLDRLRNSY